MSSPDRDPRFATTLAHGLALLEAFDADHAALSNKALAERSGLSKASVSRLSSTLEAHGLIAFDAAQRLYRLASGALTLGYPLLAGLDIRREARMGMKALADEIGGTVSLGLREGTRVVYVETNRSPRDLRADEFRPDVGAALPLLPSAMGRAWLAAAPPALREQVLNALPEEEVRRWQHSTAAAIEQWQRHGYCISPGDWRPGIQAVAVPLAMQIGGQEPLLLNCGLPASQLAPGELKTKVAPKLLALARRIETLWHEAAPAHLPLPPAEPAPADIGSTLTPSLTLARGLRLLQAFRPGEAELAHAELARRLGLGGPTVVRLTHTLGVLGYLRPGSAAGRYRLGAATLRAGYPLLANLRIRQLARPGMMALSEQVGGAVSLGFRHGTGMVYVESAWRSDARMMPPDIGAPMPMLRTSMGRAWLAQAAPRERQAVLNQLRLLDPVAFERFKPAVDEALRDFSSKGFCASRGDFRAEVHAFAVPFCRPVDGTLLVMNCGVLAGRFSAAEMQRRVALPLRELVHSLELELGLRDNP